MEINEITFTEKIKKSSSYVYQNATNVLINRENLIKFVNNLDKHYFQKDEFLNYFNNHLCNISDHNLIKYEELIAYVCVVDSLNFCFWPLEKEYNDENNNKINFEYDDYVSNLNNLFLNERRFFLPENLKNLNILELKEKVFSNLNFPLLEERTRSLNELGKFILNKYKGHFCDFVKENDFDCEKVFILI